ncbi:uncharacterized protein LOC117571108 isoform X1 [Drosophila albomicans]|uniref:Uncharacterized protein LOC117571108 isoform X1 n=1 Tax=Drosophila albomicans TaxID=7291 RepID=A0A6P8WYX2_DROAB|nr:uncharacterized protein LOC117571108 isoform X1 [Drosophila albomicans]
MVDQLHDDDWINIVRYLTLRDQLSLMCTCQYFENIVKKSWQCTAMAEVDADVLQVFKKKPQRMHCFLQLASKSLKKLILRGAELELLLPSWKIYDFQQLHSLDCHVWCVHSFDQTTLLLAQIFPNVTELNIKDMSGGHGIWNFKRVQELTLNSTSLNAPVLDRIFAKMPLRRLSLFPFFSSQLDDLSLVHRCTTLKEFVIHDFNLKFDMLRSLLNLPNFYRLTLYTREYYENYMRNLRALEQEYRVTSLIFRACFWFFPNVSSYIVRFKNLRRLVMLDDDIDNCQLMLICSQLKHLESLHLMQISESFSASDFWNMVDACNSLKEVSISFNDLEPNFLEESKKLIDGVFVSRNSPLTLHVYNTILDLDVQETLDALQHPLLEISFDEVLIETLATAPDAFIETEFVPNELYSTHKGAPN